MTDILAICGSLRVRSSNRLLVDAAQAIAGAETLSVYVGLGDLPHFNPDQDDEVALPDTVRIFRERVDAAKAVLVSVPEYAHGIPGAFKNALDWLVGSTALLAKPVAIWSAGTRAVHAPAQLREVLRTMAATIDEDASIEVEVDRSLSVAELLKAAELRQRLTNAIGHLIASARGGAAFTPY